ncbi:MULTISPECIES: GrpB family protein [Priestia]|uniref:GrpB family protein n=1 Tax=Priestia TaxID=2800373 RepID=UPI0009E73FA7|nr:MULTISPECIES: GrpB family protein [Priestia]
MVRKRVEKYFFDTPPTAQTVDKSTFIEGGEDRTHHVHMYEQDHSEVGRHLRFRDYLRKHPDEAWEYACLKQELAKKYQYSPAEYVGGKTSFIQMIDQKALRK